MNCFSKLLQQGFTILFIILLFNLNYIFAQKSLSKGLQQIELDIQNDLLTSEEALVQKFYFTFNKSQLDNKYQFTNDLPNKCATQILREFNEKKDSLSRNTIIKIENCRKVLRKQNIETYNYLSPSGNFELNYTIEGTDAVPSEDLDNSGIPDYVERIASYFDYSWKKVVDTLGYLPPNIEAGPYQIFFENMYSYGYCEIVNENTTHIAMHNNFEGFAPNNDPEGNPIGAAKVTAIHEFMHACQYMYNNWHEPSVFLEMHATWTEEIGYDYVNDYYSYLYGSHITSPEKSLFSGGGYNRCIFILYLSQNFGAKIVREIWERIGKYGWEDNFWGINFVLSNYGTSLQKLLPEYFSWCYLSGENYDSRFTSFEEAEFYPTSKLYADSTDFPLQISLPEQSITSANFICNRISETEGYLGINYQSEDHNKTLVLLANFNNDSAVVNYYKPQYSDLIDTEFKLEEINKAIILPVNTNFNEDQDNFKYSTNITSDFYREVQFTHTPIIDSDDLSPKTIEIGIKYQNDYMAYKSCTLNYKFNNGDFNTNSFTRSDNWGTYYSEISGIKEGDTISYYFSYYDSLRNFNNTLPLNAPDSLFSFVCEADTVPPTILHHKISDITKYDYPIQIFSKISDNHNVSSTYIEYFINDGDLKHIDMEYYKDSIYISNLFNDTTFCNTYDKISYRIIAKDNSSTANTTFYPDTGYINVNIQPGIFDTSNVSMNKNWDLELIDTLTVTENLTISDLNLFLDAQFINSDSLAITLTSPTGETINIINHNSVNCINASIIFDNSAGLDFTQACLFTNKNDVVTGHYKTSVQPLDQFNGLTTKGDWIINIYNNSLYINSWGLIIQSEEVVNINDEANDIIPTTYSLSQNYPNPFNPTTTINYSIAQSGLVELKVYDLLGREVATLINKEQNVGNYKIDFNASNLASGIYLYRIKSGNYFETKKMILLK